MRLPPPLKTAFKSLKTQLRGARGACAGCGGRSIICNEAAWARLGEPEGAVTFRTPQSGRGWSSTPEIRLRLIGAAHAAQPELILETGTFEGLGTAALVDAAPRNARLVSFDLDDPEIAPLREANIEVARRARPDVAVSVILGDTRATLARSAADLAGWGLWFQDSDHTPAGIAAEWFALESLAAEDALCVFDDVDHRHPWAKRFAAEIAPGRWCWRTWFSGPRRQFWAQRVCGAAR